MVKQRQSLGLINLAETTTGPICSGSMTHDPTARGAGVPDASRHFEMAPHDVPSASADDHRLAAELAHEAGRLLVSIRHDMAAAGASAAELKTAGDQQALSGPGVAHHRDLALGELDDLAQRRGV